MVAILSRPLFVKAITSLTWFRPSVVHAIELSPDAFLLIQPQQAKALFKPVPQISINSPYSKSGKSYGWEYWDSAFCGKKAEKKGKNHYGEKAEKKAEIFSIFISAFSPYNREYWDSALEESRKKSGSFLHIHFRFFSIKRKWIWRKYGEKRRTNMEKLWTSIKFSITFSMRKWRMNMEKSWTSIIFSIRHIERNTGLQMAWSFLTWITPIIKPANFVHHFITIGQFKL